MAAKFRVLGDSTRLAILRTLMTGGEMGAGRVVGATGRTQTNVFKHLKRMAEAGLLARHKEGLQVFYRLDDPVVEELGRLGCDSILEDVKEQLEQRRRLLDRKPKS